MSDGVTRTVDRFELDTWDKVMRILSTEGPQSLRVSIRAAENADAKGRRWPRGKVHDVATAAYVLP